MFYIIVFLFQLKSCREDGELRTLLCQDDTMDVLQSIGYRGVPSKETLRSRDDIIRYVL